MSGVKSHSSTVELHPKLRDLSAGGESGILGVAVKCVDIKKNTGGEGLSGMLLTLRHESWGSKQD